MSHPDMNSETPADTRKSLRFSLWELLALTTFIAVLMGLPHETLGFLVAVAWVIAILIAVPAASGKVFKRVNEQVVSRKIHEITARIFPFLAATIVVGTISLATRQF